MGSAGYIIGGALQGIGGAMAQQAQMDAEQRRQFALENLRQQNSQSNMRLQADLNDANAARSDARGDFYDARKTSRSADVDAASDARKFGYQVELKKMDFANDMERTRLESALAQGRDAATMQLRSQIESGEIKQIVEGGDGQYYAIRGDGSRIATSVPVPAKKLEPSGSGSILDQVRAARGDGAGIGSGASSAPAPAPSKTPAPAKPTARAAAAEPAPVKPGSRGSVTMAQVDALARERGLTRAEALRFAEQQGYTVERAPANAAPAGGKARDDRWREALGGQSRG